MRKNVGVIGLGIIGRRVVSVLRKKGFPVFVWNRTPRPVPNFVGSPAELAQTCEIVQIFVSDDDALLRTVQQMGPKLTSRHIIVAHPTVSPDSMRAAAEMVEKRRAKFVEAPFTGSKLAAEKGELIYYVAGDEAALRSVAPVLAASSKAIVEIGEIGDATIIKVATNMITAATVQAAAEAMALVESAGVSLDKFLAAMRQNGSHSGTLELKVPRMIAGDFEVHFSTKHMLKDMQIAKRLARSGNLDLSVATASRDELVEQVKDGRGDDDYSCVARKYFPDAGSAAGGSILELFEREPGKAEAVAPVPVALSEQPLKEDSEPANSKADDPPKAESAREADATNGDGEEDLPTEETPTADASETLKSELARAAVAAPAEERDAPLERRGIFQRWRRRPSDD